MSGISKSKKREGKLPPNRMRKTLRPCRDSSSRVIGQGRTCATSCPWAGRLSAPLQEMSSREAQIIPRIMTVTLNMAGKIHKAEVKSKIKLRIN
jgi:hypothetical protein